MENIKKYIVGMDSETYAISLVEEPAIEEDFVALAKQKEQILFETNEKHMIYGAVLVPDKDIYRNNGEQEYFISFTKESIEKMSQEYMKEYRQREVTLDHEEYATEICLVETWIKSDMNCDKSVALGLNPNLPIGTWFAGMKVNNIETWERIKNGELKGFSVESMVSLEDFAKQTIKQEAEPQPQAEPTPEPQAEPQPSPNEPPPVPQEEVVEPTPEPQPQEEPQTEPQVEPQAEPEPNPLEDTIKSLQAEIDALKTKIADLTEENKELGKLPSAEPVKPNAKPNSNDAWENWRKIAKQYV